MTAPITGTALNAAPRLKVGIVSAGRVGTALGEALTAAGHQVVAVHALSDASRQRAQQRLPGARVGTVPQIVAASDLILLAVPDTELPSVVESVARSTRPGQIVAHTAGAHGIGILQPVADTGALVLALHPAMTFVGSREDTERLRSSCFGITSADEIGDAIAASLVLEMGGTPVRIAEGDRTLYHAALAHGANNLIALITDAVTALGEAISDERVTPGLAEGPRTPRESLPRQRPVHGLLRAHRSRRTRRRRHRRPPPRRLDDVDPGIAGAYRALAGRAAVQSRASEPMLELCEVTA